MKKLLLILSATFVLSSCSMYQQFRTSTAVGDFRQYTAEGFVITPATTGYAYDPVATMEISFYPGYKEVVVKEAYSRKALLTSKKAAEKAAYQTKKQMFHPDYDYMLAELVKQAKAMGATGIMDLKIQSHYTYNAKTGTSNTPYKYTASGFAVIIK